MYLNDSSTTNLTLMPLHIPSKRRVRHFGDWCVGPTLSRSDLAALRSRLAADRHLPTAKTFLSVVAGSCRLDILYLLHRAHELCVCDMAEVLGVSVSALSHQLTILRRQGLVRTRKDAQTVYYSFTPAVVPALVQLLIHSPEGQDV